MDHLFGLTTLSMLRSHLNNNNELPFHSQHLPAFVCHLKPPACTCFTLIVRQHFHYTAIEPFDISAHKFDRKKNDLSSSRKAHCPVCVYVCERQWVTGFNGFVFRSSCVSDSKTKDSLGSRPPINLTSLPPMHSPPPLFFSSHLPLLSLRW